MSDHIIVIFDRSGSMGKPFEASREKARSAEEVGEYQIKILAAQERLIAWLRKAQFEVVTIIPFHSDIEASLTASLRDELSKIEGFIRSQQPGGDTNLQAALTVAIEIGLREPADAYVQYLIVTDGLSQTIERDVELVDQIPRRQGVNGILIDPTEEGERHLKRLCVRGSYVSVASSRQLTEALAKQDAAHAERIQLNLTYRPMVVSSDEALEQLKRVSQRLNNYPALNRKIERLVSRSTSEMHQIKQQLDVIGEQIADQRIPIGVLIDQRAELLQNQSRIEAVISLLEKCYQRSPHFEISLSHPELLSKRFTSLFAIRIYTPDKRCDVEIQLKDELREWGLTEQIYDSDLVPGLTVVVKLTSPEVKFSEAAVKRLEDAVNATLFTARPDDACHPGAHAVVLSITDKETNCEYESIAFKIQIVDFAFDHISRPLLSNLASVILGICSLATFVLTLIGRIDTTFGLASGTTAGALATFIYSRFQQLYNRPNAIVNHFVQNRS